jgi:hypothetical protein
MYLTILITQISVDYTGLLCWLRHWLRRSLGQGSVLQLKLRLAAAMIKGDMPTIHWHAPQPQSPIQNWLLDQYTEAVKHACAMQGT